MLPQIYKLQDNIITIFACDCRFVLYFYFKLLLHLKPNLK